MFEDSQDRNPDQSPEMMSPQALTIEQMKKRVYAMVVDEMAGAQHRGDTKRFDSLADRALFGGDGAIAGNVGSHRRSTLLDAWRITLTVILVIGLIVIISLVVSDTEVADAAAPYVSIFSGLVGIAVGWLFGSYARSEERGGLPRSESPSK